MGVASGDKHEVANPVFLGVGLLVVYKVEIGRVGHEPRRVLSQHRHAVKIEQNVHALTIGLGHPQVEDLQRRLADQFRVEVGVNVAQLIDGGGVVKRVGHERHADGVEPEALDLGDLLLPAHGPQVLGLQDGGVEAVMADTADLDFLALGIVYLAGLGEVAGGHGGVGHRREAPCITAITTPVCAFTAAGTAATGCERAHQHTSHECLQQASSAGAQHGHPPSCHHEDRLLHRERTRRERDVGRVEDPDGAGGRPGRDGHLRLCVADDSHRRIMRAAYPRQVRAGETGPVQRHHRAHRAGAGRKIHDALLLVGRRDCLSR